MTEITEIEFRFLKKHLLEVCGIAVPPEKRYLFSTRLSGLLEELGYSNFSQFYQHLREHDDATTRRRLVEAMTTHETCFFRDEHPFQALQDVIIPTLAAVRQKEKSYLPPRLRFLSVGASSGEEVYSVAITSQEWIESQAVYTPSDVDVLGVDISQTVLQGARRGWYQDERIVGKMRRPLLERYFEKIHDGYRVRAHLRSMVTFTEINLNEPIEHLGAFDVILCRNVIIYFALELKRRVIAQLHDMLKPNGVLLVGASETLYQINEAFEGHVHGATTFYVRKGREDGCDPWS